MGSMQMYDEIQKLGYEAYLYKEEGKFKLTLEKYSEGQLVFTGDTEHSVLEDAYAVITGNEIRPHEFAPVKENKNVRPIKVSKK